jgi:hypothetical protein
MTQTARTSIAALPRGHELGPATFAIFPEQADAYARAVGDEADYGDAPPPLAVVALALRALQDTISLPEGSLHTGQEVEHHAAARLGEPLSMRGRVAQRSERQGFVISVIELEVASAGGSVLTARTTIMAPGGGA